MSDTKVSGNPFGILKRALVKTAHDQLEVRRAVATTVKKLIKGQFDQGVDPEGRKQVPRADGKDAFISKRLPGAIKVTPTEIGVQGIGELKESKSGNARRQWLDAHQEGHEFPARRSQGYRTARNASGRRISVGQLRRAALASEHVSVKRSLFGLRKTTKVRRTAEAKRVTVGRRETFWRELKTRSRLVGSITNVLAHTVGKRVLPARRIYPEPEIGRRWGSWVKTTVAMTLSAQLRRNVDHG